MKDAESTWIRVEEHSAFCALYTKAESVELDELSAALKKYSARSPKDEEPFVEVNPSTDNSIPSPKREERRDLQDSQRKRRWLPQRGCEQVDEKKITKLHGKKYSKGTQGVTHAEHAEWGLELQFMEHAAPTRTPMSVGIT